MDWMSEFGSKSDRRLATEIISVLYQKKRLHHVLFSNYQAKNGRHSATDVSEHRLI